MKLHSRWSFTSIAGASPQAPRHSVCWTVNSPSAVVSPGATPRRSQRCLSALVPPLNAHGRLVQTLSLKRPTGCVLNML
jgi:hypothetical protein